MTTKLGTSLSDILVSLHQDSPVGEKVVLEKKTIKGLNNKVVEVIEVTHFSASGLEKAKYKMWLRDMTSHYMPLFSKIDIDEATKQYFDMFYENKIDKSFLKKALGISEERFQYLDHQYNLSPDRLLIVQQRYPVKHTFSTGKRRTNIVRRKRRKSAAKLTDRDIAQIMPY